MEQAANPTHKDTGTSPMRLLFYQQQRHGPHTHVELVAQHAVGPNRLCRVELLGSSETDLHEQRRRPLHGVQIPNTHLDPRAEAKRICFGAGETQLKLAVGAAATAAPPPAIALPHSPQNLVPGGLAVPHTAHVTSSRFPHSMQNLRFAPLSVPQLAQVIDGSTTRF
jgi:hypothetical protein